MRRVSLLVACLALPPSGAAGPWAIGDGAGYARVALAHEEVEGLSALRSDLYAEYGLSERWTTTLKLEQVAFDGASDFNSTGARLTLRRSFLFDGPIEGALEAGILEGAAIGGAGGCETFGYEARASIGVSERLAGVIDYFAFADGAIRSHEDGCMRYRLELAAGQRIARNVWSITQVWLDEGDVNARSHKLQSELLWRRGRMDYSIGLRHEFGGAFSEEGIFLALARRF